MRSLLWQAARTAPVAATVHIVLALLASALAVAEPTVLANAVNAVVQARPIGMAWTLLALVLVGGLLVRTTAGLAGATVDIKATRLLRSRLLRHALRLGTPHTQPFAVGDLVSRVGMDASLPGALLSITVQLGLGALVGIAGLVALALLDWPTAVVLVVGAGVGALIVRSFVTDSSPAVLRYQQARGELATRLVDACRGARTIRASGTLGQEIDRVLRPLTALRTAALAQWKAQRRLVFRMSLTHPLLQVLVLAVAGFRLAQGHLALGNLLAVLGYANLVLGVFDQVDSVSEVVYVRAGAQRVQEVLTHAVALPEPTSPQTLPADPGSLRFDAVSLRLGGDVVLDTVTMEIVEGSHVAVVGRSGAGKSALCSLAGRLIDPDGGRMLLRGADLRTVASAELRRQVTYAFEKPELFGDTIHNALAAGRPWADRAEVVAAARAARADQFISCLPEGYDTPLAGLLLSGGEVQRLGIARALVCDAALIVLDDATSSVDTATEAELLAALHHAWTGRTALLVAHRLVTAVRADQVAWLDGGRLRMFGPHRTLWSDRDYRALFGHQATAVPAVPAGPAVPAEVSR